MIKTQKAYYYIIRDLIPLTRITGIVQKGCISNTN